MKTEKTPRNIKLLGATSLFNDFGSEMIAPILPFYITALGGGGIAVGLVSGLREGFSSLANILGGWLSDRIGKRRPLVFLGYLISVIMRFFIFIANSWQQVLGVVALERLGKSRDSPRDAIISMSAGRKGKGFGIQQALDTTGAILGTLAVLFLFWKFQLGFKTIILIASIVAVPALIPLFFIKDPKSGKLKKSLFRGIKSLNKSLRYFIFVASFFALGNFGLYMFLLLRAKEISGSIIIPIALYVVYNLFYALLIIPFGKLSDRIGRKKVLVAGYFLFFLISIGFIFASGIVYLGILFALYGLVFAITQSNQRAFISDISGNLKGTAFGTYYAATGIVTIIGGLVAGYLWNIGYTWTFIFVSIVAFISLMLIMFVKEKLNAKNI